MICRLTVVAIVFLCFTLPLIKCDYLGRLCNYIWGKYHWSRDSNETRMTVNMCIEYCSFYNYSIVGLTHNYQCYCDDTLNGQPVCTPYDRESCAECLNKTITPCTGEPSMACGGLDWYSMYDANFQINTCKTQTVFVCPENSQCNWTCNVSLSADGCKDNYDVQGTEIYSSQSGYCAAALHNGRYDLGNSTTVVLERSNVSHGQVLQGSWNRGIFSVWDSSASDTFVFLSEYVVATDTTANLNLVSIDLSQNPNTVTCYANDSTRYGQRLVFPNGTDVSENVESLTNSDIANVGTYCSLTSKDLQVQYSESVIPLVQPFSNTGVLAQYLTYTIPENSQNVSLTFFTNITDNNLDVVKSDRILPSTKTASAISYLIPWVTYQDEGIYELRNTSEVAMATTRLIVVSPDDTIAANCSNRGYMQNNVCICSHPYYDPVCGSVLPKGTFGPDGQYECARENCTEQVICCQDPVGCHCASGWTGSRCSEPCPYNSYGTDCQYSQDCHCNNSGCDPYDGSCPEGLCEPYYFGPSCTLVGPWLSEAPYIEDFSYDFVTVGWSAWNGTVDADQLGPPTNYVLTFDNATNGTDWFFVANFSAQDPITGNSVENFTCNVTNLSPRQTYAFRVQTIYDEQWQKPGPEVAQYLPCSQPVGILTDFAYFYDGTATVNVTWLVPDSSQWHCDTVNVLITVNCDEQCGPSVITSNQFDAESTWGLIAVSPFSYCYTSGFLVAPDNLYGENVVNSDVFQTNETAPPQVESLDSYALNDGSLLLAWAPPVPPNGKLLPYQVIVTGSTSSEYNQELSTNVLEMEVNTTTCQIPPGVVAQQPLKISVYANTGAGPGAPAIIDYPNQDSSSTHQTVATTATPMSCDYEYYWITIVVLAILVLLLVITLIILIVFYFKKIKSVDIRPDNQENRWESGDTPAAAKNTRPSTGNARYRL